MFLKGKGEQLNHMAVFNDVWNTTGDKNRNRKECCLPNSASLFCFIIQIFVFYLNWQGTTFFFSLHLNWFEFFVGKVKRVERNMFFSCVNSGNVFYFFSCVEIQYVRWREKEIVSTPKPIDRWRFLLSWLRVFLFFFFFLSLFSLKKKKQNKNGVDIPQLHKKCTTII